MYTYVKLRFQNVGFSPYKVQNRKWRIQTYSAQDNAQYVVNNNHCCDKHHIGVLERGS